MQPFTAFLAAEHLNDLLREADEVRRAALVRTGSQVGSRPTSAIGRLTAAARRLRLSAGARVRPARV